MKRGILCALLACCAGCSGPQPIPPPTEMAEPNASVKKRIREFEDALNRDGLEKVREPIEAELRDISAEYGEVSVEYPQALTETGLLILDTEEREPEGQAHTLATPYFERALLACQRAYTPEHRECGYSMHDAAVARINARRGSYDPVATMLLERALGVRTRVLGADHAETGGTEVELAEQRLRSCRLEPPCDASDARLKEASALVRHAKQVFESHPDQNVRSSVRQAQDLLNSIESEILQRGYSRAEITP
jgi:hypothetical protein